MTGDARHRGKRREIGLRDADAAGYARTLIVAPSGKGRGAGAGALAASIRRSAFAPSIRLLSCARFAIAAW